MQGNMQQLKGSWNEVLGKVKEHWGNLTDDDLNVGEGNIDQLIGRIQKRTGEARNAVTKAIGELSDTGESVAARTSKAASEAADYVGERVHEGTRYIASQADQGYEQAQRFIRQRPAQSIAVMFGIGIGLGVLLGLSLRSR